LRYYEGKELPTNVLVAVKQKYPSQDIFGVTEFTNDEQVIYYIKLYNGKEYTSLKAYSDGTISNEADADNTDDTEK